MFTTEPPGVRRKAAGSQIPLRGLLGTVTGRKRGVNWGGGAESHARRRMPPDGVYGGLKIKRLLVHQLEETNSFW
jgi:hypothetical protein